MNQEPRRDRKPAPTRRRAKPPTGEDADGPAHVRVYVSLPAELRRKIGILCEAHGVTISDLVRTHLEATARAHVISIRSGGTPFPTGSAPIKLAETEPPADGNPHERAVG